MHRERIGIDLDNTITDTLTAMNKIVEREFRFSLDFSNFDVPSQLKMTEAEFLNWTQDHVEEIHKNLTLFENAKEVLSHLFRSFEIYLITAREYWCADITKKFLFETNIKRYFTDIYFSAGNKVECCKWRKISWMIEDSPKNAQFLTNEKISVILFARDYNQNIEESSKLKRLKNWLDIEKFITENSLKF